MVNTGRSQLIHSQIFIIYLRSWDPDSALILSPFNCVILDKWFHMFISSVIIYRSFLLVFIPYNILRDCSFFFFAASKRPEPYFPRSIAQWWFLSMDEYVSSYVQTSMLTLIVPGWKGWRRDLVLFLGIIAAYSLRFIYFSIEKNNISKMASMLPLP